MGELLRSVDATVSLPVPCLMQYSDVLGGFTVASSTWHERLDDLEAELFKKA